MKVINIQIQNKNSQISVFVLITAIILILGVVIFISQSEEFNIIEDNSITKTNSKVSTISEYVALCLENSTEKSIIENLKQGGYKNVPNQYIPYFNSQIPIYLQYENLQIPTISVIENELENSIEEPFLKCINDFNTFKSNGYNITYTNPSFDVVILNDTIQTNTFFPLNIIENSNSNTLNIEQFNSNLEFNFSRYYDLVTKFVNYNFDNEINAIPTSYLNEISYKNDFLYVVSPQNSEMIVYSFTFNEDEDNYLNYQFAIMYNLGGLEE